jgi:predicted alpha/beta-fold hydrolase
MSGKIIKSSFKPARGLKNRHMSTMYQTLFRKIPKIMACRERLELPNNDFVDLDWVGEGDGPIVIVLHGLAGSLQSFYAAGIMLAIKACGWRGVIMYYRGTSSGPNRLLTHTHLGETESLNFLVNTLSQREPNTPLVAVGFSMGANLLLKWEGETAENNPLKAAAAVSVPFDLRLASNYMRSGFSNFYQQRLLRDMRFYIREKFAYRNVPDKLKNGLDKLDSIRSFWQFDDLITAPLHNYKDAAEYYYESSSRNYLKLIQRPTLILHARDDPFMPEVVIPNEFELADDVTIELSDYGGHVGFVSGTITKPVYWLEQRIPQFLAEYI